MSKNNLETIRGAKSADYYLSLDKLSNFNTCLPYQYKLIFITRILNLIYEQNKSKRPNQPTKFNSGLISALLNKTKVKF